MKRLILLFAEAILLLTSALISAIPSAEVIQAAVESEVTMNVIGYIPTWKYECYKTTDMDTLTHINIAFVNPDRNGVFSSPIDESDFHDLVALAHEHDVKVIASLGGWGGWVSYPENVCDGDRREKLNSSLFQLVEKFGLDGIDLDIEGDVRGDFWAYYDTWVSELRRLCDEKKLLLTTAVGKWYSQHISDYALSQFDLVNMMVYDAGGENHSSYEFALENFDYYLQRNVAPEKLVLGVPFYGRDINARGMDYDKIIEADPENYYKDSYEGYCYNNAEMIARKCRLAEEYGGIMIWELSADAEGEYSLLKVISEFVG